MRAPHWLLDTVKTVAAREDGMRFSLTRALRFFPTRSGCLLAARATVAALIARVFVETLHQNPDVCDVYAVRMEGKGWYVKLTMLEESDGQVVMLLSLHPLEHEIRTAGGHKVKPLKKGKAFRCGECGQGTVRPLAKAGRRTRHKTMTLELPADLEIPTCHHCGAEWFDDTTASQVDEILEGIYRHELRERVRAAIDTLTEHVSQRKMERMLGLSHGYLSKLRNGACDPSPELVGNLALLAHDPEKRIRELGEYWGVADDGTA